MAKKLTAAERRFFEDICILSASLAITEPRITPKQMRLAVRLADRACAALAKEQEKKQTRLDSRPDRR